MYALILACALPPIPDGTTDTEPAPGTPIGYDVDVQPRQVAAVVAAPDCDADPDATFDAPLGTVTVTSYEAADVLVVVHATFADQATADPAASWLDASADMAAAEWLAEGESLDVPIYAFGGCGDDVMLHGDHAFAVYLWVGDEPFVQAIVVDATVTLE